MSKLLKYTKLLDSDFSISKKNSNVDTFTTAIFFVGMWLMAKRKIENWIFWIIGDIISIPLYFYKGFTFTAFQYLGFTFIAIVGYLAWKKSLNKNPLTL